MLDGVEETATWTTGKIAAVRKLTNLTVEYVRRELPKIYSRELLHGIFSQPYCRIANLVEAGVANRQAAARHPNGLLGAGVTRDAKVGPRKIFLPHKMLHV